MVVLRNPHDAHRWGFLFACPPNLSAWVFPGSGTPSENSSSRLGKPRHVAPSSCLAQLQPCERSRPLPIAKIRTTLKLCEEVVWTREWVR
jgi:hypothetical protein